MAKKLDFLTKELIDRAVAEIDKSSIPSGREGTKYAVRIAKKNYPFKLIITEAAKLRGIKLSAGDFSSNDNYRNYFEDVSGYTIIKLKDEKPYFNLAQLREYHLEAKKLYKTNSIGTTIYYDTRSKLQYLGEQLAKVLDVELTNNYNEKPNKMAGKGKGFVLKEYILTGFLPVEYSQLSSSVFIKFVFQRHKGNLEFGFDVDVNWSDEKNDFNKFRKQFQSDQNWKIPVDNTFPKNWNDLINITKPILKKQLDYLDKFLSNKQEMNDLKEYIKILKHKKQIILQGPPGTGKTYTAKKIAEQLVRKEPISTKSELTPSLIKATLTLGQKLDSPSGKKNYYSVNSIDDDSVELQSEKSQPWKPKYSNIISKYNDLLNGKKPSNVNALDPYEIAVAKFMYENLKGTTIQNETGYTLVQFHPSYSYEDFVRGISAISENGNIIYKTENKVFGKIIQKASRAEEIKNDTPLWRRFRDHLFNIEIKAEEKLFFDDRNTVRFKDIYYPEENNAKLRYEVPMVENDGWTMQTWIDLKENFNEKTLAEGLNVNNKDYSKYWIPIFNYFKHFAKSQEHSRKSYVLIIDEINRANLPSVLGELIYALEYRGKPVNSIYAVDGNTTITIPENLYIIGTMNTADRSVGHIDYAIKRRFAFVDMLPKAEVIGDDKAKALFNMVSELFTENYLASDFNVKDVHIGHSYFLFDDKSEFSKSEQLKLKLDYEILPILNEYVKDGLLLETAKEKIQEISKFEC